MQKGQGVSTLSFGKIKADSFNIFPFCNFHMLFCSFQPTPFLTIVICNVKKSTSKFIIINSDVYNWNMQFSINESFKISMPFFNSVIVFR